MAQTQAVVIALRGHGADVERAVGSELARLAQQTARTMRRLAAKNSSALVNSIAANPVGPMAYEIGAHVAHAPYVEDGVKPGGKGLPRFFDPAAKSVVDWLVRSAFGGQHKPRMGSRALQSRELELRDRYEGLAWHIRHFGTKAQPFVKPAFDELTAIAGARVGAAVQRAMAQRSQPGTSA